MSSGCCSRQPREAQNSDSLKMSCCSVTIRSDVTAGPVHVDLGTDCRRWHYRSASHLAQHPRRLQLLLEVQVDQPPVHGFELARRARRRAAARPARPALSAAAAFRNRSAVDATTGAPPAGAQRRQTKSVRRAAASSAPPSNGVRRTRARRRARIDALQPQQPELEVARQRARSARRRRSRRSPTSPAGTAARRHALPAPTRRSARRSTRRGRAPSPLDAPDSGDRCGST